MNPYATFIDTVVGVSVALFFASLIYAYKIRTGSRTVEEKQIRGYILIGLWVLLPPIWFFVEFQLLHPNIFPQDSFELSRVKQSQELARNVWLAFVVVLAAIVGVKWPPGS